jgi:hypothetical protein
MKQTGEKDAGRRARRARMAGKALAKKCRVPLILPGTRFRNQHGEQPCAQPPAKN